MKIYQEPSDIGCLFQSATQAITFYKDANTVISQPQIEKKIIAGINNNNSRD